MYFPTRKRLKRDSYKLSYLYIFLMIKFYLSKNILLFFLLLRSIQVWGQTRVTGKVTAAEDGAALPGVSIHEKGTSNGTVTDVNGAYAISIAENAVLVFSFVGFTTQEVSV